MTIQQLKTIAIPVGIILLVIFLGTIILLLKSPPKIKTPVTPTIPETPDVSENFKIIRARPTNDLKTSTSPTIEINFDGTLDAKKANITTDPSALFSDGQIENNNLTFKPLTTLLSNTKYTAYFYYQNKLITQWQFETSSVTASENELGIIEKIKSALPYKEDAFTIGYVVKTDRFFVFLNKEPIEETKNKARKWFESQGLQNPESKINIVWFSNIPPKR